MLKRLAAILVAVTLTTLTGVSPAEAYEGETYEELIEDRTLNDQHAIIVRFYRAVFGRTPDNDGVRFWLDQYDTGDWSTRRIANFFATSDEFKNLYGEDTSNAEFVDSVYPNVLGRTPDATGRAFWIGYLDDGNSRAELILLISNAPEFTEANWLPFEAAASTCALEVAATTDDDALPIDGDDEFVTQLVTITTTANAGCEPLAGVVGTIGWRRGSIIDQGTLVNPFSVDEPRAWNWLCFPGQQAVIEWSIRSLETVNGGQALGVESSGSTMVQCGESAPPPPPADCTFTPSVVAKDSGLTDFVDLTIEVAVTECEFAAITSSIGGEGSAFDRESTSSPHSPDEPVFPCGASKTYTISAFDTEDAQIGEDFVFTVDADDYQPCSEPF